MTKTTRVLIALGILSLVIVAIGSGYFLLGTTEVSTVMVKNVFVDIDNDGDLDLLVSGEVVINEPPFEEVSPPLTDQTQ